MQFCDKCNSQLSLGFRLVSVQVFRHETLEPFDKVIMTLKNLSYFYLYFRDTGVVRNIRCSGGVKI